MSSHSPAQRTVRRTLPESATLQRHTGIVTACLALAAAALNYAQLTHFDDIAPIQAVLSPYVGLMLLIALVLSWTAIGTPRYARPVQVLVYVMIGMGNAIDAEPGNLTAVVFLGIAYVLMLQYEYLNRGSLWKSGAFILAFIGPFAVNTVALRSLPPYSLITTVAGAAAVVYIGTVMSYVRFSRQKRRERELEETVRSRTETLEARMHETERLKAELERSLEEKELLLKEVHHRTKNNMQLISSVLNLENRRISDPAAVAALTDGIHRVKALALAHEHLYGSEDLKHVELESYTRALLDDIWKSLGAADLRLEISFSDSVYVDLDFAIPFGLILNELVANTAKHAYNGGSPGTFQIAVSRANEMLLLTVQDDGPGLSSDIDLESPKTMGIQLIVGLTHQLDGSVSVHNESGTKWEIAFRMRHQHTAA